MEILDICRFLNKRNKTPKQVYENCILRQDLYEKYINEENEIERENVIQQIRNNDFIINDYDLFLKSLFSGKRNSFLTKYSKEEFKENNIQTFQVKGQPIGFALHFKNNGSVDIISVHNNSNVHNIGDELLKAAIRNGGNELDHFDGFLSDFYKRNGFEEYDRYEWDNQYAPEDWDYEKYGTPDVVYRKLKVNTEK